MGAFGKSHNEIDTSRYSNLDIIYSRMAMGWQNIHFTVSDRPIKAASRLAFFAVTKPSVVR